MTLAVREFLPSDAGPACEVMRAVSPYLLRTPQTVAQEVAAASPAERFRMWVAETDGSWRPPAPV